MLAAIHHTPADWGRNTHTDTPGAAGQEADLSLLGPPKASIPSQNPIAHPLLRCVERINQAIGMGDIRRLATGLRQTFASPADNASPQHSTRAHQLQSVAEERIAPPRPLPWATPEPPENPDDPQSAFYVERQADSAALRAIQGQGVTITITGPRQAGKTALLARMAGAALARGKYVTALDLQAFETSSLRNAELFFKEVCDSASCMLGVEPRADSYATNNTSSYHCTRYFEQCLLPQLGAPLVLAIDKVDSLPDMALRSDFFAMLRAWCSNRAASQLWRRLDLVLVTSTEPHQLIRGQQQSPFNSAETIVVSDFTADQVADLNERHGRPFAPTQQQALMGLLGGHPYLIRQAFYLAAIGQYTPAQLLARATDDPGPFADHLRYQLFKLHSQPRHVAGLRQILHHNTCDDEQIYQELHGAGLVRREGGRALARCRLYTTYFRTRV